MTPADEIIQQLLLSTQGAIDKFQRSLPGIQKGLLDEITVSLKELDTVGGKILNNVKNLKTINALRNKIERLIVSQGYKDEVKDFIKAFDQVETLQLSYFATLNQKFTPSKTLPIIKTAAIDKTLNDLLSQGLQSNVVDKVYDILTQNATTGGSYASLTDQLRDSVIGTDQEGLLQRYGRTITTDAINQYSAQYHDTLAQDLNFNWGRYVGSNITTTREFCELLTDKEWVHRSELPAIIEGKIDGHQCKLNKKGLPLGMIPGTDVNNFKIRRGGYNCGHQFFWVPDSAVPKNVKDNLGKPTVEPTVEPPVPVEPVPDPKPAPVPAISPLVAKNKEFLDKISEKNIKLHTSLLKSLPGDKLVIETTNRRGAWYDPRRDAIFIGDNPDREESPYFRDTVMAHELGHAIHFSKEIITLSKVSEPFADHFSSLQKIIKGKAASIESQLNGLLRKNNEDNSGEQLVVLFDILGSLTKGKYGHGHPVAYYKRSGYSEMEIFAHGVSLLKVENQFTNEIPEMKAIVDKMVEYSKTVL